MAELSKERELIAERWRNVFFASTDGKEVLQEIVEEAHVFDTLGTEDVGQIAVRNFAVWMLYRLGVIQDMNMKTIIDNFATMPYKEIVDGNT